MPQPDYTIRQNDQGEPITATLEDLAGTPVNLTGASVAFTVRPISGGDAKLDAVAATIVTPAAGAVKYIWRAADTDTPGWYLGSWTVTFSGGEVQTFPNGGYTLIQITAEDETSARSYLTTQEFKDTLEIDGNYADKDCRDALDAASRIIDGATARRFYLTEGETRQYTGKRSQQELLIGDWSTVTSVALDANANGSFTQSLVEGTDFDLEPYNAADDGRPYTSLRLRNHRRFPYCRRNVQIVGDYGWASPPDEVKRYTSILATQLLLRARQAPFGILMAGVEIGTSARLARFDPDFQRLLGHLTNARPFA